ncbi:MAG TPA: hypothetical protein DCR14_04780, partial [Acidimicrobiaceae bacterium]|nr:hypothetical protein [Acidimicrobiaceae bacterium]
GDNGGGDSGGGVTTTSSGGGSSGPTTTAGGRNLPSTGSPSTPISLIASCLLVLGSVLLVRSRRPA